MSIHIVTSWFYTKLPPHLARLSIARWAPAGHRDLPVVRELAPGPWFRSVDVSTYRRLCRDQLGRLDPRKIVAQIEDLAAGCLAALLCWERPPDEQFCHRASCPSG